MNRYRGTEVQRHRGTEEKRKRGKEFFPFVPLCLCPFAPFCKMSNGLEKQAISEKLQGRANQGLGIREEGLGKASANDPLSTEKQGLGIRDQGLGKTASDDHLSPNPYPLPPSLPLTPSSDPCHSSKTENSKRKGMPSRINFFKMSALLLIILGLSKATAGQAQVPAPTAAEMAGSLTTAYRNSASGDGGIGTRLSNAVPTRGDDRAAPSEDKRQDAASTIEDGESAQNQPQALDSALCIRDMDIKTLLKALALKHKVTIVSTPTVDGRISLNLNQTSLEDTLTAIARIMGLIWTKDGSVYILSQDKMGQSPQPPFIKGGEGRGTDFKSVSIPGEGGILMGQDSQKEGGSENSAGYEEKSAGCEVRGAEQNAQSTTHDAQSLRTTHDAPSTIQHEADPKSIKVFHINYADLKELSKVIQWSFEKIRTTAYPQDDMILVEGDSKEIALVQGLIQSLDVPPRQTLIEAQILEINLSDDMNYGIDWSGTFSQGHETSGLISSPGAVLPSDTKAGDASSQFLFGILRPHFYVKLSALEKKGDVKTLAKPRIMVLDGKSAQILIGGRLGYYLTTTTQTSTVQSVEFLDIGTQLKLVPHIAEDGNILMDIQPEVSDGSLSSGLPQKTTTSVSTSVMVKAGETIFIGGLIRNSEIKQRDRLPVLGHIPVLGTLLFSKASNQTQRKELVILLTPYLVPNSQKAAQGRVENPGHSSTSGQGPGKGGGDGETGRRGDGEMSPCPPIPLSPSPKKEASPGVTQDEMEHWKGKMKELGGKEGTREQGH